MAAKNQPTHTVIVGGGFAGMAAAKALGKAGHQVTLLDKRNFQLFQPLLYQVAVGLLPTGDVAAPHRVILKKYRSVTVLQSTALDIDPTTKTLHHEHGSLQYDQLLVTCGVKHAYFGRDEWAPFAPGLKTLEHALLIRRRVIGAFEHAETLDDPAARRAAMRFVVVGGGPTGVELAGAIAELAHHTMPGEFRRADPREAEVILLEAGPSVLPVYSENLRAKAITHLQSLGVTVRTGCAVTAIDVEGVRYSEGGKEHALACPTVLWAAGVQASAFGQRVAQRLGAQTDRAGRIVVDAQGRIPQAPEVWVLGDLAARKDAKGTLLPGLAQGALQSGQHAAACLIAATRGRAAPRFVYRNMGSMAVIGTHRAVGDLRVMEVSGWMGWWMWAFVHIMALIDGRQRLRVFITWAWRYLTREVGDRLVTGAPPKTAALQAGREGGEALREG